MDDTERIIRLKMKLEGLEEWVSKMQTQIVTINERTKKHTKEIKQLQNEKENNN